MCYTKLPEYFKSVHTGWSEKIGFKIYIVETVRIGTARTYFIMEQKQDCLHVVKLAPSDNITMQAIW